MFTLGQKVRDVVTGFTGIATSRVEYLNGCIQFCVTPVVGADGKMPDSQYLDHQRLELVGPGIVGLSSETGGVMRDTPSTNYNG